MKRSAIWMAPSTAVVVVVGVSWLCHAQMPFGESPQRTPATQPAKEDAKEDAKAKIWIDRKAGTVSFDTEVCGREGMDGEPLQLELLLTKVRGKTHESILQTEVDGWQIHAGLVALGLPRGKPKVWRYDLDTGAETTLPPRGPKVDIFLEWTDGKGKKQRVPASQWLKSADPAAKVEPPSHWVFVGSILGSNGGYAADAEGEFITTANFGTAILDVPFVSSDKNAELYFLARPDRIPPLGTKVTMILKPVKGAAKAEHVRKLLYIDRFGRLRLEGEDFPFDPKKLTAWAGEYLQQHKKGKVVIRAAGRALVEDITRARLELKIGGLHDVEIEYDPAPVPILPRTPGQVTASLKEWKNKFANPADHIEHPAREVGETLSEVKQKLHELKVTAKMLEQYQQDLEKMRKTAIEADPNALQDRWSD
ncbi:MAG: YdjY domain-containing protein [Phycisphaerae bacterium]